MDHFQCYDFICKRIILDYLKWAYCCIYTKIHFFKIKTVGGKMFKYFGVMPHFFTLRWTCQECGLCCSPAIGLCYGTIYIEIISGDPQWRTLQPHQQLSKNYVPSVGRLIEFVWIVATLLLGTSWVTPNPQSSGWRVTCWRGAAYPVVEGEDAMKL